MSLTDLQKANFRPHIHFVDQIMDDQGDPIDPGGGDFQPLDADLTTIAGLAPTNDDVLQYKSSAWANRTMAQLSADLPVAFRRRSVNVMFGDGSAVIAASAVVAVEIPFAWTDIISWRILSVDATSGSIVVDVQKTTYSSFSFSSIAASAKPTLSSATKNENTTLTGWTKTGSAGDILKFITEATPSSVKAVAVSLVLAI